MHRLPTPNCETCGRFHSVAVAGFARPSERDLPPAARGGFGAGDGSLEKRTAVERIGAQGLFDTVIESVAVAVGIEGVGAERDFLGVGKPVAIGIGVGCGDSDEARGAGDGDDQLAGLFGDRDRAAAARRRARTGFEAFEPIVEKLRPIPSRAFLFEARVPDER